MRQLVYCLGILAAAATAAQAERSAELALVDEAGQIIECTASGTDQTSDGSATPHMLLELRMSGFSAKPSRFISSAPVLMAAATKPRQRKRRAAPPRRAKKTATRRPVRLKTTQQSSGLVIYNGWGCRTCGYENGVRLSGTRKVIRFAPSAVLLPDGGTIDLR